MLLPRFKRESTFEDSMKKALAQNPNMLRTMVGLGLTLILILSYAVYGATMDSSSQEGKKHVNVQKASPIMMTDSVISKVKQLLDEEGIPYLKLRAYITGGGCSGFEYGFTFDEVQSQDDFSVSKEDVTLSLIHI